MTEKMLKFVNIGQQIPPKRDKYQRKEDFEEILMRAIDKFPELKAEYAVVVDEVTRCKQCKKTTKKEEK